MNGYFTLKSIETITCLTLFWTARMTFPWVKIKAGYHPTHTVEIFDVVWLYFFQRNIIKNCPIGSMYTWGCTHRSLTFLDFFNDLLKMNKKYWWKFFNVSNILLDFLRPPVTNVLGVRTINTRLSFIGSVVHSSMWCVVWQKYSIVIEKYQFRPHMAKWLGYYLYPKVKEFHDRRTWLDSFELIYLELIAKNPVLLNCSFFWSWCSANPD